MQYLYSQSMNDYIDGLSENEKKAMEIAKAHLESSFSLEKSIGYIKFSEKKENKENKKT